MKLLIFTDGSSKNNQQPSERQAGSCFLISKQVDTHKYKPCCIYGYYLGNSTNNYAELYAIEQSLKILSTYIDSNHKTCILYTDSKYSIDIISGKNIPKTNINIIKSIQNLITKYDITFKHIDSHSSKTDMLHKCNNLVDEIAVRCAINKKHYRKIYSNE